jgi:hypothetical protein
MSTILGMPDILREMSDGKIMMLKGYILKLPSCLFCIPFL